MKSFQSLFKRSFSTGHSSNCCETLKDSLSLLTLMVWWNGIPGWYLMCHHSRNNNQKK